MKVQNACRPSRVTHLRVDLFQHQRTSQRRVSRLRRDLPLGHLQAVIDDQDQLDLLGEVGAYARNVRSERGGLVLCV